MIDSGADALEHALELQARPSMLALLHERPLPNAVLLLIRIAAGDRHAIQTAASRTSVGIRPLSEAAVMYLRQVLFVADADHYRLLGLRADAGEDAFKEHYRWLMRWLHPDRDPTQLGQVDAQRVNSAWHILRSNQRRLAYDRERAQAATRRKQPASVASVYRHAPTARMLPQPLLSPRTVHYLPVLVLGGLTLIAGAFLAGWHWLDEIGETNVATLRAHRLETGFLAHARGEQAPSRAQTLRVAAAPGAAAIAHDVPQNPSLHAPARPMRSAAATVLSGIVQRSLADTNATRTDPDRAYAMVPKRLAAAYAQGSLTQMMQLFSPDAMDDRGGIATIADEYARLFRRTRSRRLRMGTLDWNFRDGRVAVATGAFDARMRRRGRFYTRHLHGRMVLELAMIGGQWKIHRIALQETQR